MKRSKKADKYWFKIGCLAVLSGILYSSWPLGSILNPNVAHSGLASGLEGLHQPYNWVFITGDILSGLLVSLVCWLVWQRLKRSPQKKMLRIVLMNVALFGVGTIIDAMLPLKCEPSIQACPSFVHDHSLLAHGIFSILPAIFLFVSLFVLWWHHQRRGLMLNSLVYGYILFSLFSLVAFLEPAIGNLSQHYYLALCAVWLALLPHAVREVIRT